MDNFKLSPFVPHERGYRTIRSITYCMYLASPPEFRRMKNHRSSRRAGSARQNPVQRMDKVNFKRWCMRGKKWQGSVDQMPNLKARRSPEHESDFQRLVQRSRAELSFLPITRRCSRHSRSSGPGSRSSKLVLVPAGNESSRPPNSNNEHRELWTDSLRLQPFASANLQNNNE